MKTPFYLGVGAAFVVCTALAAQIDIPHQFMSGTPARAAEVNANFATLAEESNTQDSRLAAVENSSLRVSAQMLCKLPAGLDGPAVTNLTCVRSSNPGVKENLTYTDAVAEGWIAVSFGGDGNYLVVLFNQYEAT